MPKKNETETVEAVQAEPEYTAEEFAENSQIFGVSPDLVIAAFRTEGITAATKTKAESIVNAFKNKPITN